MKFPTYEEMAKDVAEKALDEYIYQGKTLREWVQIISENQDSDCISRKEVLKLIEESVAKYYGQYSTDMLNMWGLFSQMITERPSVTPQPKIGHWIVHPKGIYAHLVCDKCLASAPYNCRTNYCPSCGAKMVEPQESEE